MNYEIVFVFLFLALMAVAFGVVLTSTVLVGTIKAGKVTKHCPRFVFLNQKGNGRLRVDGQIVDVSKMLHLTVCGNSMRDYQIVDGQEIYAQYIESDDEKNHIPDHPVLVFSISNAGILDSQYKLRKFVDYGYLGYGNDEWGTVFDRNSERIKIERQAFLEKCRIKAEKLQKSGIAGRVALSETYDEDNELYDYSLHPVNTIIASVEYAV